MTSSKEGKLGSEDMRISNAWNSLIVVGKLFQHQFVDFSFPKEGNDNTNTYISLYTYWGEALYWGEGCNKYLKFNDIVIPIAETLAVYKHIFPELSITSS